MPEPEHIGKLLEQWMRRRRLLPGPAEHRVGRALREIVGADVSKQVKVRSFRGGTLRVGVMSAPLREELGVYRLGEIKLALQERLPGLGLRDLRFEIE